MNTPRIDSNDWWRILGLIVLVVEGAVFKFENFKRGLMIVGSLIAEFAIWVPD